MSPSLQNNKSNSFQLFKPNRKKPKQQGSEKSLTKQTHAQDMKNAESRETEGGNWDEHIEERSRS